MSAVDTLVLIADENTDRAQELGKELERRDFKVSISIGFATLQKNIQVQRPDIAVVSMPMHGSDIIGWLSQEEIPVIAYSSDFGGNEEQARIERILNLEMGASDAMTLPLSIQELEARIKAILRRVKSQGVGANGRVSFNKIDLGNITLDLSRREVTRNGDELKLTTGEFDLLVALAQSPNVPLSRDQLFELLGHAGLDAFSRSIDVQVGRLRRKLGDDPREPKIIKTIPTVGYLLSLTSR